MVYGADPGAVDKMGRSAADYAKQSGQSALANRIVYSQYELSDRLSFYLCQRRPDHLNGEHFVIPKDSGKSEDGKMAKRRLQVQPQDWVWGGKQQALFRSLEQVDDILGG